MYELRRMRRNARIDHRIDARYNAVAFIREFH